MGFDTKTVEGLYAAWLEKMRCRSVIKVVPRLAGTLVELNSFCWWKLPARREGQEHLSVLTQQFIFANSVWGGQCLCGNRINAGSVLVSNLICVSKRLWRWLLTAEIIVNSPQNKIQIQTKVKLQEVSEYLFSSANKWWGPSLVFTVMEKKFVCYYLGQ